MFAVCEVAASLNDVEVASKTLNKLLNVLVGAPTQAFVPSPALASIVPSPAEALSYRLTSALLCLSLSHPSFHDQVWAGLTRYLIRVKEALKSCSSQAREPSGSLENESAHTILVASVAVSLLGFLEASSRLCKSYDVKEQLELVRRLRSILEESFMVTVEGVFSSLRTPGTPTKLLSPWKRYAKQYTASGRPLGATLLQNEFTKFLVSCSSLQVCTAHQSRHDNVLDLLLAEHSLPCEATDEASTLLLETLEDVAIDSIHLLEDGLDYLRLGTTSEHRLAFSTKSNALQTFLHCRVAMNAINGSETLLTLLEDAMSDSVQMENDELASTVLKGLAIVARSSRSAALSLSRSVPRFIVQSGIKGDVVSIAARCLAYILLSLSQDAVITGLYSLGNVLSAKSNVDRVGTTSDLLNGNGYHKGSVHYGQHTTGSTISLDLSGEEETTAAYGNIVRAIVTVASSCRDEKVTALAQTILLQKLGRLSINVDVSIITEAANLSLGGGPAEFKSLLALYSRLIHSGVRQSNTTLLAAVSSPGSIQCLARSH